MIVLKILACVLMGFGSGAVISGAVFAFISILNVVPRLAQKTNTRGCLRLYEEAIVFGGILGCVEGFFQFPLPVGDFWATVCTIIIGFCVGVFYGCLAVSIAEVLDVVPILTRRLKIQKGLAFIVLAIALGKFAGSILYYVIPGFFKTD